MRIDLDALKILDAVLAQGGFVKAAAKLNRSQAAISYKIKKLEEQLNVAIFNRGSYRAELTPEGVVIVEEARRLLRHSERIRTIAQGFNQGWEAQLEVVIDGVMPMEPIMRTLKLIADRKIPTRIRLKVEFLGGVQARFESDDADLMIVKEYRESPFHAVADLPEIECSLCVGADHPLASSSDVSLLDLHEHVKLTVNDSYTNSGLIEELTGFDGDRIFYLSDFGSKKDAIILGLGYGWLPNYMIGEELSSRKLCVVDSPGHMSYRFTPKFVTRTNRTLGKAGQLFRNELFALLAPNKEAVERTKAS